ncbi:MAG: CotH kinase family protein [Saprospiraceae bacterium]|nr:CotH kinase family protein [Saprospiraceae bacterium]
MKKIRHIAAVLGIALGFLPLSAQVVLNEFQASNATTIADPVSGDFNDWVELHNTSNASVNLTGWHLTDSNDSLKWEFPSGWTLPAGGFLLLWADGTNIGLHPSFKLGASGEQLALYDNTGLKVDQIAFVEQPTDVSYGRQTDGGLPWGYFAKPTPGASNETSVFYEDYTVQVPVFSQAGGFFNGPVTVNIQDLYNAGTIRYTVNGAEPTLSSPVFAQPLEINATTVVKARMFYANRLPGPVVTNTYFINEGFEQRDLPVLSLSTNPDYFFGQDSGLYVQDFKPTWEYPVHLEFYEPDGLLGFHHDAGVQVGGENAWILPQKLLNIYSRKQYGSGHFEYQIFPNNPRKRFGDLVLRCSGSDWSYTLFRDGMMQGLIDAEADLDVQDFRPCSVFINGQYFGIHNIREKQDADYTEHYHGIDPDSLDYIENNAEIKEGDDLAYQGMVALLNGGVQSDASFQLLDAVADTKNFTDYIISEIFVANTSWGHNIALFRKRSAEGRWRWLLHDYDRGFDLGNVNGTAMDWATSTTGPDWSNGPFATLFLRKMLENNAFRERFITRFADHLYITFNPTTINRRVDRHAAWIRPEMSRQVARWLGTTSSYGTAIPSVAFWENKVNELKQFGAQRNAFLFNDLSNYFGFANATTLNLDVSNPAHGFIRLHEMKVPSYPWTGKYFQNRQFTLTAEARPGFNFVRWEKLSGTLFPLIAAGSTWKYSDATTAPPADWKQPSFNDATWDSGAAQLGYGEADEATTLSYGSDPNNKTPSYYFRTDFEVSNASVVSGMTARLKVDDGAVVYLNGNEVGRVNMPVSPSIINFNTFAAVSVTGTAENAWNEITIPTSALVSGQNLLAVEVHQYDGVSSDISFDLELLGTTTSASEVVGTSPVLEVTLDAIPRTLRAIFESDGSCGILPDTVFQNLTLTAACSPYIAAGDVTVKPNVTLTVEPGVEIQFPEKANLYVQGGLKMNGTAASPILVKNTADSEVWGGIFLKNTTAVSALNYVKLENPTAGSHRMYFPAAISAYNADMNLDHLDLTAVKDNPVFARFSDVRLTNSKLKSAVTGDCINVKQGFARVENCEFEGGREPDMDAIDYDGVMGGIVLNNIIHDFRGDNCDGLDIGEECQDLLIEKNFIYHCFDKGISVGQQSTATIRDNVIAYTAIGIALKDQSVADVEHCTFFGNQQGVSAYEKNPGNLGGTGSITDCMVSNAALDAYIYDTYSGLTLTNCLSDLDSISTPGTWNTDPHFGNPTWYDFHLMPNSPAIGLGTGGTNLGAITLPVYDGQPRLMFSEILYDDTLTTTGEFLEIYNPGTASVDLSGYHLALAVDFVFPAGATIAPNGTVIVAKTAANLSAAGVPVFEWTDGRLRNEGESIHLFDADGLLVDFVRYNNHVPWPEADSLQGRSIELVSGLLDNHFATSWKASEAVGGTPGEVSIASGTTTVLNKAELAVYPNPAAEWLNVAMKTDRPGSYSARLMDEMGRTVFTQPMGVSGSLLSCEFALKSLSNGVYAIAVLGENGQVVASEKLMVVR